MNDDPRRWPILWPEYGTITADQIRTWYADAVANGGTKGGLNDVDEMARELDSIGHITLGRIRRL